MRSLTWLKPVRRSVLGQSTKLQSFLVVPKCGIYPRGYIASTPGGILLEGQMSHTVADKQKLLNRVRRLMGQVDAIERALDSDTGCNEVMRLLTSARGAINGIMAEVVEDHIEMHMVDPGRKPSKSEADAADELIDVLRSYIR